MKWLCIYYVSDALELIAWIELDRFENDIILFVAPE